MNIGFMSKRDENVSCGSQHVNVPSKFESESFNEFVVVVVVEAVTLPFREYSFLSGIFRRFSAN